MPVIKDIHIIIIIIMIIIIIIRVQKVWKGSTFVWG